MKNTIITLLVLVLAGVGLYFLEKGSSPKIEITTDTIQSENEEETGELIDDTRQNDGDESVIGKSVQGREITAYHYGNGGEDMYLVKINSNGDTLWTKTYGGAFDDEAKRRAEKER